MTEFRSRWGVYLTRITIGGNTKTIRFAELRDGNSYYATSKWEEVEALKNHPGFNKDFTLFREDPNIVKKEGESATAIQDEIINQDIAEVYEPEKEETGKDVVKNVVNISQAREYLKNKGVTIQKLKTPKSILKYASEMGVEFPNLKEG